MTLPTYYLVTAVLTDRLLVMHIDGEYIKQSPARWNPITDRLEVFTPRTDPDKHGEEIPAYPRQHRLTRGLLRKLGYALSPIPAEAVASTEWEDHKLYLFTEADARDHFHNEVLPTADL